MNSWTPENIAALIVAITGLVTAAGAIIHSRNTRTMIPDKPPTATDPPKGIQP